jgi:hypothetical protein
MTGAIVGLDYRIAAERLAAFDGEMRARVLELLTGIEAATLQSVREANAGEQS